MTYKQIFIILAILSFIMVGLSVTASILCFMRGNALSIASGVLWAIGSCFWAGTAIIQMCRASEV